MSADHFPIRRVRTILDVVLFAALILAAVANFWPAQARLAAQPSSDEIRVVKAMPLADLSPAAPSQASDLSLLDDSTLAAMIAAENAALTLPQYFVGLPVINR
jgi:hypothetical protein